MGTKKLGRPTNGDKLKKDLLKYAQIFQKMSDGTGKDYPYSGKALILVLTKAHQRIEDLEEAIKIFAEDWST
jgi:hypothetical protein